MSRKGEISRKMYILKKNALFTRRYDKETFFLQCSVVLKAFFSGTVYLIW